MRSFGIATITFLLCAGTVLADSASDFAKANREYAAEHYQAATEGYEALVRAGERNSALFYNLGNAWYRRGDRAHAILNYERALALDPHHAEATANLRLVRDQARALELAPKWPERFLSAIDETSFAWLAAVAFWIGLFALAMFFFRRSAVKGIVAAVAFVVCGCAIYALYLSEDGNHGRSLAIVLGKNIEARLATADNANSILALPPGSEVKVLSTRGDWSYAALPNDLRGWIPTNSAELVRL
jgi:tetratricopeptide (TPR) repeat protein